jgi:hypothetical protein
MNGGGGSAQAFLNADSPERGYVTDPWLFMHKKFVIAIEQAVDAECLDICRGG